MSSNFADREVLFVPEITQKFCLLIRIRACALKFFWKYEDTVTSW